MPRFKTHLLIGAAAGSAYSLAVQAHRQNQQPDQPLQINPLHVVACSVAAAIGACIPDKLEPADRTTGPNHRGKFHSIVAGAVGVTGAYQLAACETSSPAMRWIADLTGAYYAGYVSHLAADAFTPRGLNFVCKGC